MNKPFEKHVKTFVTPVCAILADAKAPTRAAASTCLTAMATACEGIDNFISSFGVSLESQNPLLRGDLLTWMSGWLKEHNASVAVSPLVPTILACLEDRAPAVRKAALEILPAIVAQAGYSFVMEKVSALKGAMQQTIRPVVEAARASAATPQISSGPSSPPLAAEPVPRARDQPLAPRQAPVAAPASIAKVAAPAMTSSIAKTGGGTGARALLLSKSSAPSAALRDDGGDEYPASRSATGSALGKRPASTIPSAKGVSRPPTSASAYASDVRSAPFKSSDPTNAKLRSKKDAGRFVFSEKVDPTQVSALAAQMESQTNSELYGQLFSTDHSAAKDFIKGLETLGKCFDVGTAAEEASLCGITPEQLHELLLANLDLVLKYLSIRMYDSNPQAVNKSLEVIKSIVDSFSSDKTRHSFDDYEIGLLLPTMIFKVTKNAFRVFDFDELTPLRFTSSAIRSAQGPFTSFSRLCVTLYRQQSFSSYLSSMVCH